MGTEHQGGTNDIIRSKCKWSCTDNGTLIISVRLLAARSLTRFAQRLQHACRRGNPCATEIFNPRRSTDSNTLKDFLKKLHAFCLRLFDILRREGIIICYKA